MTELPALLRDRLGPDGPLIEGVIDQLAGAISDQYTRDAVAYDDAEGDNAWTFAVNLHAHLWARAVERIKEGPDVHLVEEGLAHAVQAGPLTIRPYKLGRDEPEDVRLIRLDPSSATKAQIAESNDAVVSGQLALDLARAVPAPSDAEFAARYAPDLLVMGHFGNPRQGRRAIYLGAPRPTLRDGSYWEWVIQLAGPGPEIGGQIPVPHGPVAPTPAFSERQEPEIPLVSREDERRREHRP
jgi:hypothetical protein